MQVTEQLNFDQSAVFMEAPIAAVHRPGTPARDAPRSSKRALRSGPDDKPRYLAIRWNPNGDSAAKAASERRKDSHARAAATWGAPVTIAAL